MAKIKAHNNNTRDKSFTTWAERYPDLFFFREYPTPDAVKERIAMKMIEFADRPTSLRVQDFWDEEKIDSKYYWKWKEGFPLLERAYAYCMSRVASRRDIGALKKEFDAGHVERHQVRYDPEYKEVVEWKAKLAHKEEGHQGNVTVVLESFGEHGRLPVMDKEEKNELA